MGTASLLVLFAVVFWIGKTTGAKQTRKELQEWADNLAREYKK